MQIDLGGGFQIDIVAVLALLLAGWSTWIAYRADRKADAATHPVVEVKIDPLAPHWWTVTIETRNRADYGLDGVSLECVSPSGGLLMQPVYESIFNEEVFQIRSVPSTESARRTIPLRIALAAKRRN